MAGLERLSWHIKHRAGDTVPDLLLLERAILALNILQMWAEDLYRSELVSGFCIAIIHTGYGSRPQSTPLSFSKSLLLRNSSKSLSKSTFTVLSPTRLGLQTVLLIKSSQMRPSSGLFKFAGGGALNSGKSLTGLNPPLEPSASGSMVVAAKG